MKNIKLLLYINGLLYFFTLKSKIRTAIFSKTNFPTSPNFYNYLILNNILLFYLGEVVGEVLGKYGEVMGKFKMVCRKLPQGLSI